MTITYTSDQSLTIQCKNVELFWQMVLPVPESEPWRCSPMEQQPLDEPGRDRVLQQALCTHSGSYRVQLCADCQPGASQPLLPDVVPPLKAQVGLVQPEQSSRHTPAAPGTRASQRNLRLEQSRMRKNMSITSTDVLCKLLHLGRCLSIFQTALGQQLPRGPRDPAVGVSRISRPRLTPRDICLLFVRSLQSRRFCNPLGRPNPELTTKRKVPSRQLNHSHTLQHTILPFNAFFSATFQVPEPRSEAYALSASSSFINSLS